MMTRTIGQVRRLSAHAARRALAGAMVARAGLCAAIGAAFGLGAVAAAKVGWVDEPLWLLAGGPAAAGILVGFGWAVAGRWSQQRAAAFLDHSLGLKDQLRSALEFEERPEHDPFVSAALADAATTAGAVDVRTAVPIRAGRAWWYAAAGVAISVAGAIWVPARNAPAGVRTPREIARERERVADQVRAITPPPAAEPAPPAVQRELDAVQQIERELARGEATAEEARTSAAGALERAADAAAKEAEATGRRADALRTALARSAQAGAASGAFNRDDSGLAAALRRGDIGRAAEAASSLETGAANMSPEARERAAEELAQLARDLDEIRKREEAARSVARQTPAAVTTGPESDRADSDGADGRASGRQEDAAEKSARSDSKSTETSPAPPSSEPTASADSTHENQPRPSAEPQPESERQESPDQRQSAEPSDAGSAPEQSESRRDQHRDLEEMARALRDAARELRQPPQDKPTEDRAAERPPPESKPRTPPPENTGAPRGPSSAENKSSQTPQAAPSDGSRSERSRPQPEGVRSNPGDKGAPSNQPSPPQPGTKSDSKAEDRPASGGQKSQPRNGAPGEESAARPGSSEQGSERQPSSRPDAGRPDEVGDGTAHAEGKSSPEEKGQRQGQGEAQNRPGNSEGSKPQDESSERSRASGSERDGARPEAVQNSDHGGDRERTPADRPPSSSSAKKERGADSADAQDAQRELHEPRKGERTGPSEVGQPKEEESKGAGRSQPETPTAPPSMNRDALRSLAERLHKLADSPRSVQGQREMSRDLREQAKKMLENASPEDLRRIAEMMRGRADDEPGTSNTPGGTPRGEGVSGGEGQRPGGGAHREWDGPTDLVDARGAESPRPGEKFSEISRWSGDPDSNGAPVPAGASAVSRVRAAAAGAERAVEQQVVPSRYGPFVKRVFRKYVERAAAEGGHVPGAPPAAAPDAPDARPR